MQPSSLETNGRTNGHALVVVNGEYLQPARLSQAEEQKLIEYEAVIRNGLKDFITVGEALARVRSLKLFRNDYDTFEEYVRHRWGFGKSYASRLISTADVGKYLSSLDGLPAPTHATQLRPLIGLEAEKAAKVWDLAATKAGGGAITEAIVKRAFKELTPRRQADAKPKRRSWAAAAKVAKALLEQAAAVEQSLAGGKDNQTGFKFVADVKRFLESLASRTGWNK